MKKNKPQNHSAATPQGGAAAHSDIVLPIVPRQEPRSDGATPAREAEKAGGVTARRGLLDEPVRFNSFWDRLYIERLGGGPLGYCSGL